MSVACVTMVYNEPEYLPLWVEHYSKEVGRQNLYIVDHSSTDRSLDAYRDLSIIRVPRSVQNDKQRTKFLSGFCSSLLEYYQSVIYTDCDEILVADPDKYDSLHSFCFANKNHPAITAVGLNVTHVVDEERDIDLQRPLTEQRKYVRFVSPMCKPCVIHEPVNWSPGFHSCEHHAVFKDLYMFHLRYFDLNLGLDRLERTRSMGWVSETAGRHQRVDDDTWRKWFSQFSRFDRLGTFMDEYGSNRLDELKQEFLNSRKVDQRGHVTFDRVAPNELFVIPERFLRKF